MPVGRMRAAFLAKIPIAFDKQESDCDRVRETELPAAAEPPPARGNRPDSLDTPRRP